MLLTLTGCQEPVLSELSERQANEVIRLLEKYQISASKQHGDKNKFNVLLDQQDMRRAIMLLSEYQLPSKEDVEIERFFPVDALVASPRAEKVRLISAIEQRLQQSLVRLDEVMDARVHMSYPVDEENRLSTKSAKRISVMILHRAGIDATIFTNKIRLFVLNSFPDVSLDNVTVVLFVKQVPALPEQTENVMPVSKVIWGILTVAGLMLLTILLLWLHQRIKKRPSGEDTNA